MKTTELGYALKEWLRFNLQIEAFFNTVEPDSGASSRAILQSAGVGEGQTLSETAYLFDLSLIGGNANADEIIRREIIDALSELFIQKVEGGERESDYWAHIEAQEVDRNYDEARSLYRVIVYA